MSRESIEYWDSVAAHYATMVLDNPDENEYPDLLMTYLEKQGVLKAGSGVLDLGCGAGKYAVRFARLGMHVTAMDISGKMLAYTKQYMDMFTPDYELVQADFADIVPSEQGWHKKFDFVFANMTPAVNGTEDVRKMCEISSGSCFIAKFAGYRNLFIAGILRRLGRPEEEERDYRGNDVMAEWLQDNDYHPDIVYQPYTWFNLYTVDEALEYCYQNFSLFTEDDREVLRPVLQEMADETGTVREDVESMAEWIFWRV